MTPETLSKFIGKEVVLDTKSPLVFLGRLVSVEDDSLVLEDADVHDAAELPKRKEVYVLEARKHGIKANRRRVVVRAYEIVSVSLLEDVIEY